MTPYKRVSRKLSKKVLFLSALLLGIIFIGFMAIKQIPTSINFNSKDWKNARSESLHEVKRGMAINLIENHTLVGVSKGEIIEVLDSPDRILSANESLLYYLGPKKGALGAMDYEVLRIDFDASNKVTRTLIARG